MKLRDLIVKSNIFFARAHTRIYRSAVALTISLLVSAPVSATGKSVADLTQSISDPKLSICLPAIEAMGRSKDADAVAPLSDALNHENRSLVRRYLVDALGVLGSADARPALIKALQDPDSQVRQSAVAALSIVGGKDGETALLKQADVEKDSDVKGHLVYHLGHMHNPEALKKLKKLKNDADPRIRRKAQDQLTNLGKNGANDR